MFVWRQAYTKGYFIEKYDEQAGAQRYVDVCSSKSHSIESIVARNGCSWSANYYHSATGYLAEDIWKKDQDKISALLQERGIPTLVVWEDEFISDPSGTVKRCIKWLTQKDK